jgi:hypothetical protein
MDDYWAGDYTYKERLYDLPGYELFEKDGAVPPFDQCDEDQEEPYKEDIAEMLHWVLRWLARPHSCDGMGGRVLLLSQLLGHSRPGVESYADIARAADCSRENIRQAARELEDLAGLRTALGRTDTARRASSKSRKEVVARS